MKKFIEPELIIILFESEDIITDSDWGGDIDSGNDSQVPDF